MDKVHYNACEVLTNYFLLQDSPVTQVTAVDQDFGVNDDVVYEITSGNLDIDGVESFAVDNNTGIIYVNAESLDRETYQQYTLTVMVMHRYNLIKPNPNLNT